MRILTSTIVLSILAFAGPSIADKASVVADCKSAASAKGISVRVVTGGAISGMYAYVHDATAKHPFVGALEVRYGSKARDSNVEMHIVGAEATSRFQLLVMKDKSGGEYKASFDKVEVGGNKLDTQELVCAVTGNGGGSKSCEGANKPVACPGGGAPSCSDQGWECAPLPHK